MKISCDFVPDIIEVYDFEAGRIYTWGKQPERSKREDLNILSIDLKGNILNKIKNQDAVL